MYLLNLLILWFNVVVPVPLGHNLEDYKTEPYAILQVDGKATVDPLMYYEYEINWTFFSVVNTNTVGDYRVDYKVYFPTYNITKEVTVIFRVIDVTNPVITASADIKVPLGTKNVDYTSTLKYQDNYSATDKLKLEILGSLQVNTNVVGIYPITYKVTDEAGNFTTKTVNVIVHDNLAPTIEQKSPIIINPNTSVDVYSFFTFKDDYDKVLTVKFDDKLVNYQKVGTYIAVLTVTDRSGNQNSVSVEVTISDTIKPKIILKQNKFSWNINDELTEELLLNNIFEVSDNYSQLSLKDVRIKSYVLTNIIGTYEVIYEVIDNADNIFSTTLKVEIIDLAKPTIKGPSMIEVEVGSNLFLLDYFLIDDNYNFLNELETKIIGKYETATLGEYRLEISATDKAKNQAIFPLTLVVMDKTPPVISQNNPVVIYDSNVRNYLGFFTITDNYDKNLTVSFDDSKVDYQKAGIYELIVFAQDNSQNTSLLVTTLAIIDDGSPQITLHQDIVYLDVFSEDHDFFQYILSVSDNKCNLQTQDITFNGQVDLHKVGRYSVTYEITDGAGNIGEAQLIVIVQDKVKPVFYTNSNVRVKQNNPFMLTKYVGAEDNYDGDVSHLVKVHQGMVNVNEQGIYELILSVTDSSGNISFQTIYVEVYHFWTWQVIVAMAVGLIAISFFGYRFYQQHKKFNKPNKTF